MLQIQSPCFFQLIKPSFPKEKTNFLLYGNEKKYRLRRNSNEKMCAKSNEYSFSIPYRQLHHPLESELPFMDEPEPKNRGVGILKFYEGKNIFITGATGLVGKALVEKILRSTSVGKIYVLIKAKDKEAALDRLKKEIIDSDLFKCLKEKHGKSYEAFAMGKLIPILGDICEPNLGMDSNSCDAITNEVDVIIQSAASTTLNDRYDMLIDLNVNAPQRLMRLAKTCKKLKLFSHISTAYVSGRREGMILEKPLIMGENVRKDDGEETFFSTPCPRFDLADEMSLTMKSFTGATNSDVTKNLKRLGAERSEMFGWYNAYHSTKAMGEMVLNEIRGDVPLLIIRPTVIESCYKEPFPGWIQGNRMFDPVIISYGKGQLPAFLADPQENVDIVPLDMVVNTTIAAIAKHGIVHKPQLNVYHAATSDVNPLRFSEFFQYIFEHFKSTPQSKYENLSQIKCFNNFNDFSKYTRDNIWERNGMKNSVDEKMIQKQCKAKVAYAEQLCKMYEFIGFIRGRFHTGNTQKLLEEMTAEEQLIFDIDAANLDWRKYFTEIHIPGLKKHVVGGIRMWE